VAQLSHSDMCFPIQYAVDLARACAHSLPPLDFGKVRQLEFVTPRYDDFPALDLARVPATRGHAAGRPECRMKSPGGSFSRGRFPSANLRTVGK